MPTRRSAVLRMAGLVLAALLGLTGGAAGQAPTRPLSHALLVDEGGRCELEDRLAAHVAHWLGTDVVDARLEVLVSSPGTDGEPARFRILRSGGAVAERIFDRAPPDCADLRAALSLAIALAIDAAVLSSILPETPAPPAAPAPPPAAPAIARPPAAGEGGGPPARPEPDRPAALAAEAALHVGAWLGLVPGAPAATIGAAMQVRGASAVGLRAGMLVSLPTEVSIGSGKSQVLLAAGALGGCWGAARGPGVRYGACLGAAAGLLRARGRDFAVSTSAAPFWVAATVRLELGWTWASGLGLSMALEAALPVVRPRLIVLAPNGEPAAERTTSSAAVGLVLGPTLDL